MEMTNIEFDRIIAERKQFDNDNNIIILPIGGGKVNLIANFTESDEYINIYLRSSKRNLEKLSQNSTYQDNTILIRIDLEPTAPHQNPDGQIIRESHIHVYKEGFGDKWATPLKDICDNINLKEEDLNNKHKIFEYFCWRLSIDKTWQEQLGF